MAKNEFGVESSSSGGFGAGVGADFEDMFEEATNVSVVDDEISDGSHRGTPRAPKAPVEPVDPFTDELSFSAGPDPVEEPDEPAGFDTPSDLDGMFEQAESFSVADDEISEVNAPEDQSELTDSFDSFGADTEPSDSFSSFMDNQDSPVEPLSFDTSEQDSYSEPEWEEPEQVVAPPAPEPEAYSPPVVEAPAPVEEQAPVSAPIPASAIAPAEGDVDYIERVILTSDAIRELPEDDAKAVNMFITAGQPVDSHQELVLTALLANRQILKTAEAILTAKSKSSVDRAFHILGLDDETFVDFGKILSHDLEATETVLFEGDRLQYARKLVDVVESLPAVSIKRFEAVKSVLGAGELDS